jgi:hypothetical protein
VRNENEKRRLAGRCAAETSGRELAGSFDHGPMNGTCAQRRQSAMFDCSACAIQPHQCSSVNVIDEVPTGSVMAAAAHCDEYIVVDRSV